MMRQTLFKFKRLIIFPILRFRNQNKDDFFLKTALILILLSCFSWNIAHATSDYVFDGDGRPQPGRREGAASRGNCPPSDLPLTALMPKTNLGLTLNPYPSFWFYVPYSSTLVSQAELMVLDEKRQPILNQPLLISLSQTPGIVKITLPKTTKPLELTQKYHWYFSLICDSENPSKNPNVNGWVQRITVDAEANNYQGYVRHGIWYDAITDVGLSLQNPPADATAMTEWQKLLNAVNLENFTQIPVVNCCQP